MKRAAVVIGVDKTGGLPELKDSAKGAKRFAKWAQAQGMDPVKMITDQRSPVTLQKIKDAVKAIIDKGTIEQLLVYFAGHGVNIRRCEYWLLIDAPVDPQAAVNVVSSELLARYCGIPHVVMISDACRTAAEGIQAQFVTGGEIFPNEGIGGLERPVDQFFACTLGRSAHEIRDPAITAGEYKALYTGVLLDSLQGSPESIVDWVDTSSGFVRPRALKQHLYEEVTQKIAQLDLQTKIVQIPDARITSDDNAWVASLKKADIKPVRRLRGRPRAPVPVPNSPATISQSLLDSALSGDSPAHISEIARRLGADPIGRDNFSATVASASVPFGAMHHETKCGFKIRGAQFVASFSRNAVVEDPGRPANDLRVNSINRPGFSVLLILDTGAAVVLPAIPGFLCALTIDQGELVDVAYEPSDNSERWPQFEQCASKVRTLRAVAASSTWNGVFRLEGDNAFEVARQMQYAKGVDPALAVYAAYAYQDLQRRDLIRSMSGYMEGDLGARFFDLALLSGDMRDTTVGNDPRVLSFVPLLAQGWALLAAYRVTMPNTLDGIERYLLNSPWTMFNNEGADLIRRAIAEGTVR